MSYIDKYSWKCLLGPMSKDPKIIGNLATWYVGKNNIKKHFVIINKLDNDDIIFLKEYGNSSFNYINEESVSILKEYFKVKASKYTSACISLNKLTSYSGKKNKGIRWGINKNKKKSFIIQHYFNNIKDIDIMLSKWTKIFAQKYFRNYAGKNLHFFKQNYHKNCINKFIYDEDELVAFASYSPGINSPYIVRKALTNKHPGLTEYVDNLIFKDAIKNNVKIINLGLSKGNLSKYKNKFPGSFNINHYDGKIYV